MTNAHGLMTLFSEARRPCYIGGEGDKKVSVLNIEKHFLTDFGEASRREWLDTNGIGGYASATLSGALSRGTHGLLVVRPGASGTPHVLLSTLEEALVLDGRRYTFSTQQYRDAVYPHGYRFLEKFRMDPFPVWTYHIEGYRFEKMVFLVHGENTVVLIYQPLTAAPVRFELRPLLACRAGGQRRQANDPWPPYPTPVYHSEAGLFEVASGEGMPTLRLLVRHAEFQPDGYWYRHFKYTADAEMAGSALEDLYSHGLFSVPIDALHPMAYLVATTEPYDSITLERLIQMRRREINRRSQIVDALPSKDEFLRNLALASDAFLVASPERRGLMITVGHPWPGPPAESALACLPGLLLATRRFDKAKSVLTAFLNDQGPDHAMVAVPGLIDTGPACVEEPLWLILALYHYAHATLDYDFVSERAYSLVTAWICSREGAGCTGLRMDAATGLLATAPPSGSGGWVQRVEINALWYNALRVMERFADRFGFISDRAQFSAQAQAIATSFRAIFWAEEVGYLYDAVEGARKDSTLRPFQVLAVSLPFDLLAADSARSVVDTVRAKLLTPFGLRVCALESGGAPHEPRLHDAGPAPRPADPRIVWPWLLGSFVTAYLKVYGRSNVRRRYLESLARPLRGHLREAGIGTISERFFIGERVDPEGCTAGARNVAEVLRMSLMLENGGTE